MPKVIRYLTDNEDTHQKIYPITLVEAIIDLEDKDFSLKKLMKDNNLSIDTDLKSFEEQLKLSKDAAAAVRTHIPTVATKFEPLVDDVLQNARDKKEKADAAYVPLKETLENNNAHYAQVAKDRDAKAEELAQALAALEQKRAKHHQEIETAHTEQLNKIATIYDGYAENLAQEEARSAENNAKSLIQKKNGAKAKELEESTLSAMKNQLAAANTKLSEDKAVMLHEAGAAADLSSPEAFQEWVNSLTEQAAASQKADLASDNQIIADFKKKTYDVAMRGLRIYSAINNLKNFNEQALEKQLDTQLMRISKFQPVELDTLSREEIEAIFIERKDEPSYGH